MRSAINFDEYFVKTRTNGVDRKEKESLINEFNG